jgi:hypothetical protein
MLRLSSGFTTLLELQKALKQAGAKTYGRRYSQLVTDASTNPPICSLCKAERTTKVIGPSLRHYPTKLQLSLLPSILPTGATFVVLIPTFQFSYFFKMIHNVLNSSLNSTLLKVFPCSYPCLNSFFAGLKRAFFCSNSFKIYLSRLNYIKI